MARSTPKQRQHLKELHKASETRALRYAYRLGPYIDEWQRQGLSQRAIAEALNDAGAPVPSEWTGEPYEPKPVKKWSLRQVQRMLELIPIASEKMAWWAKGTGKAYLKPFGDGAGLFANPALAPLPATNEPRPETNKARSNVDEYTEWRESALREYRKAVEEWEKANPYVPPKVADSTVTGSLGRSGPIRMDAGNGGTRVVQTEVRKKRGGRPLCPIRFPTMPPELAAKLHARIEAATAHLPEWDEDGNDPIPPEWLRHLDEVERAHAALWGEEVPTYCGSDDDLPADKALLPNRTPEEEAEARARLSARLAALEAEWEAADRKKAAADAANCGDLRRRPSRNHSGYARR